MGKKGSSTTTRPAHVHTNAPSKQSIGGGGDSGSNHRRAPPFTEPAGDGW